MRRASLATLLIIAMTLASCSGNGGAHDDELLVVATTTILGDLVRNVTADDATVEVILPIGADSHEYQPSSQNVAMLNEADLVVANGLGLEGGLLDALKAAEQDGANILVVGPSIDPIPFVDHNVGGSQPEPTACDPGAAHEEHGAGEDEQNEHHQDGDCDPHFWLDPLRDAEAARVIASGLASLDGSVDWAARAETYADRLEALDDEIVTILAAIPDGERKLVTNHEALGYFAGRYDFEILGTVIPGGSTLGEPSSADLARLVNLIEDEDVPAIFAETIEPSALADAIAGEIGQGVAVVELFTESLGDADSRAATLVGMLRSNARSIANALG